MNIQLLSFANCQRDKFDYESYIETDNILILVESGSFQFESAEGQFVVKKNEGALFRANVLYQRKIIAPANLYLFRYRADTEIFDCCHVTFSDTGRIQSTFSLLKQLRVNPYIDATEQQKYLFTDIVNQYIIEHMSDADNGKKKDEQIQKAIDYMQRNLHKKLAISELASKAALSYVQFLRRFHAYTGMAPSDYINAMRLRKAKSLLLETDFLIKDISDICGFKDEFYFSKFIKKQTGMSPSLLRKTRVNL